MSSPESKELAVVVGGEGALRSIIVDAFIGAGFRVISVARPAPLQVADRTGHVIPLVAGLSHDEAIDEIRAAINAPVAMVVHVSGFRLPGVPDTSPSLLAEACDIKGGRLRTTGPRRRSLPLREIAARHDRRPLWFRADRLCRDRKSSSSG